MSFTQVARPQTGSGGRSPKLNGDELAAAVKALRGGHAIQETVNKTRKNTQAMAHSLRVELRAALGGLESDDITSSTKPVDPNQKGDEGPSVLTLWLTDSGLAKCKPAKPQASRNSGDAS